MYMTTVSLTVTVGFCDLMLEKFRNVNGYNTKLLN